MIIHTHTLTPSHPQDLGLAAAAGGSEELFVAVLTVDGAVFLHKAGVSQRRPAVGTVELLLMPRLPHRHQKRPSEKEKTASRFESEAPESRLPSQGVSHIRGFTLCTRARHPSILEYFICHPFLVCCLLSRCLQGASRWSGTSPELSHFHWGSPSTQMSPELTQMPRCHLNRWWDGRRRLSAGVFRLWANLCLYL